LAPANVIEGLETETRSLPLPFMTTSLAVSPRHLALPQCCLFAPTELQISPVCSQEEFTRIGQALSAIDTADGLWQCDFAAYAMRRWGDEGLKLASEATKLANHYLKRFARIAEVFPPARRRAELKKTAYVKLLPFVGEEGFDSWLADLDLTNVSNRSLYLLAIAEFGIPDPKTKQPKRRSVSVRETLWARLAPHSLSKNVSALVELILENWLACPLSERALVTADLELRRQKHTQRARDAKARKRKAAKAEMRVKKETEKAQGQAAKQAKKADRPANPTVGNEPADTARPTYAERRGRASRAAAERKKQTEAPKSKAEEEARTMAELLAQAKGLGEGLREQAPSVA
jgi:hypothetical protein